MKKDIDTNNLHEHIAIIMDGNGRWAKKKLLNRLKGHQEGVKSIRDIVGASRKLGVKTLSLYAFSKENWSSPKAEVKSLMKLLTRYLTSEIPKMKKNRIEIRIIGCKEDFPEDIQQLFEKASKETKEGAKMVLNLCLSYSGRYDIIQAIRRILKESEHKKIEPAMITEDFVSSHLYTAGLGDPDLLIRTSGEQRISNYFLWQIAYSEIYVTKTLWPDFREDDLYQAIIDYQSLERRFGLTPEQVR